MKADFTPSFDEEKRFWDKGFSHVVGIDEVGRGCFAGPVVVAGVIFNPDNLDFPWISHIHDSKLLSKLTREILAPLIQKHCVHFSISEISVPIINDIGISKAIFLGMQQVCENLSNKICHAGLSSISKIDSGHASLARMTDQKDIAVLVDAFTIPNIAYKQKPISKGDQKSISIAAASIIAKVYRDTLMKQLAPEYSAYSFEKNKGYGTKAHREAIKTYGLSDMHRKSFHLEKYT